MNVLMVIERYIPIWGGAENQLRQLIPHLENCGCKIKVVTRRWHKHLHEKEVIDGVEVARIGIPGTGIFSTVIFIHSLIIYIIKNHNKIDFLHSHGAVNMGALCSLMAMIFNFSNVAKIATAGKVLDLRNKFSGRLILWFLKRSDAIIAMTEEIEQELKAIGTPIEKIFKITNGVDTKRFRPSDKIERDNWRNYHGVSENRRIVLFSSRLVYRKGLDILFAAWPEINESCPDTILMILGSGKGQPDSVEKEIRAFVSDNQIKNVIFLGESDYPEYVLGAADVFIFPSRKEGFPNALMEAMASNLPVIASKIGGNVDLVVDNETGLLFEPENHNQLADLAKDLFASQNTMEKLGNAARKSMIEMYDFPSIAGRYRDLYAGLRG